MLVLNGQNLLPVGATIRATALVLRHAADG